MKILKLRFQNINSLRGTYEIDFQAPPYAQGGLFAIVGPTGSGKSSILDAVSFALFGRTPRTESHVVAVNDDERKTVLVTRGEKLCEASVVFETKGQIWLSRCRMRLVKSNGKSVELVKLPSADASEGEIVTTKVKDWQQQVESLLGMGFAAFTRTVLLAQGAFGRFLQARPDDRAEILEGITGSEIYAEIGSRVYRAWTEADRAVEAVRREIEALEILTTERRAEEEAVVANHEAEAKLFREEEAALRAVIAWHAADARTTEREKERAELEKTAATLRPSVEAAGLRLAGAQRAAKGLQALERRNAARRECGAASVRRQKTAAEVESAAQARSTAEKALPVVKQREAEAEATLAAFRPKVAAWREEKLQFEGRRTALLQAKKSLERIEREAGDAKAALAKAEVDHARREGERKALQEALAETQAFDLWPSMVEDLRSDVATWRQAVDAAVELKKQEKKASAFAAKAAKGLAQREAQAASARSLWQAACERLEKAQAAAAAASVESGASSLARMRFLTERIGAAERLADLTEDAPDLAALPPSPAAQSLTARHAARRDALDAAWPLLRERVENEAAVLENLKAEREALLEAVETADACRAEESSAREAVARALAQMHAAEEAVTTARTNAEEAGRSAAERTAERQKAENEARSASERFAARIAPLAAFASGETPEDVWRALLAIATKREAERAQAQALALEEAETVGRLTALRRQAAESAERARAEQSEWTEAASRFKTERSAWQATWEKAPPEEALQRLEAELSAAQKTAVEAQERSRAATALHESLCKRLADETESLRALERARESAESDWGAQCERCGFVDEAALREALLSEAEEASLSKTVRDVQAREARMTLLAAETMRERAALDADPAKERARTLTAVDAEAELAQLRTQEREAEAQWGRSREILRADDERRTKAAALAKEEARLRDERSQWLALNELIGDAVGKRFRTIAQGITFRVLIEAANRVLRMMKSRYGLVAVGEPALEIAVIDHDMADTVRSSTNLSGGESFIVSLALALGLSNLSGSRLQVETLFLDEGFGTLDEATLHTALGVLDDLRRMTGRLIGVISHVAAVKERIETQIVVTPERGRGVSRIEGPGVRRC